MGVGAWLRPQVCVEVLKRGPERLLAILEQAALHGQNRHSLSVLTSLIGSSSFLFHPNSSPAACMALTDRAMPTTTTASFPCLQSTGPFTNVSIANFCQLVRLARTRMKRLIPRRMSSRCGLLSGVKMNVEAGMRRTSKWSSASSSLRLCPPKTTTSWANSWTSISYCPTPSVRTWRAAGARLLLSRAPTRFPSPRRAAAGARHRSAPRGLPRSCPTTTTARSASRNRPP